MLRRRLADNLRELGERVLIRGCPQTMLAPAKSIAVLCPTDFIGTLSPLFPHTCALVLVAEQLFPEPAWSLVFQKSRSLLTPPISIFTKIGYHFL